MREDGWAFQAQRAGIGCEGMNVWDAAGREATPINRMEFIL